MTKTYEIVFILEADASAAPTRVVSTGAEGHPQLEAAIGLLLRGRLHRVAVRRLVVPHASFDEAARSTARAHAASNGKHPSGELERHPVAVD